MVPLARLIAQIRPYGSYQAMGSWPANKWGQVTSLVAKDIVGAGTHCVLSTHCQWRKEAVIFSRGRKNATIYEI